MSNLPNLLVLQTEQMYTLLSICLVLHPQRMSNLHNLLVLQTEQMYTLLSICLVLHPQRIDEAIQSTLREKTLAEKIARMSVSNVINLPNLIN